jgi:hypothetical protein
MVMRILAVMLSLALAAGAEPPTGSEEIAQLVAERHYPQALQKISTALGLKGPAAKAVDRYQLYMLKAECHLQTRAAGMAQEAYANAVKAAGEDGEKSAIARAHEMLVKQSKAFAYVPKSEKTKGTTIDILDPANRKKAFAAMLADELAANDAKLQAAKKATSLPPIAEMFKPLATMEGLELAGTGDTVKVKAVRGELAEQSKKLLAEALRGLNKRLGEIDKDANTFVEFYQDSYDAFSRLPRPVKEKVYKKKGLTDAQQRELSDINATCDKLGPALIELGGQLRAEEKVFEPFGNEAGRIRKEVDRVLDTDYQRVYREIPKK